MSSYWDAIIPIVTAWVANKYGGKSGDTPNSYPAELPPEMKRVADEAWRVYLAGGSPTQQDIRSLALQSAAQTPSEPTGFKFVSQELQGQQFAGGIKAPKYDVSKLPSLGGGATSLPGPTTPRPPGSTPAGGDPMDRLGGRDFGTDTGSREAIDYGPNVTPADGSKIEDAWNQFKTAHPNWARLGAEVVIAGIASLSGLAGGVIAPVLRKLMLRKPQVPLVPGGYSGGDSTAPPPPKQTGAVRGGYNGGAYEDSMPGPSWASWLQ